MSRARVTGLALPDPMGGPPLSRAERQKIQRWYDQAVQFAARGDAASREETHRRLAACLNHDPGNSLYTELMLTNLKLWIRPLKTPNWWTLGRWRRQVARLEAKGDWQAVQEACWQALLQWEFESAQEPLQQWARCAVAFEQLPCALILLQHWPEAERDAETWSIAAQTLVRLGRFEDADEAWRHVRALEPQHPLAPDSGVSHPPSTPAVAPTDAAGMMAAAQRWADADQWTLAQKTLQQAMSASPGDPQLQTAWEDLQLQHVQRQQEQAVEQGLSEDFHAELRDLRARLELEIFDARATRRPEEPHWRLRACRILIDQQRWSAALRQLEPLPDSLVADSPDFPVWMELTELAAELLQRQRDFESALERYRQVIESWDGVLEPGRRAAEEGARLAEAMGRRELAQAWSDLQKTRGTGRQMGADEG